MNDTQDMAAPTESTPSEKRSYQTRYRAGDVDMLIPEMLIPTSLRNSRAFSLSESDKDSHIMLIRDDARIEYNDRTLYIDGKAVTSLEDVKGFLSADLSDMDLRPLRIVYGALVQKLRPLLDNRSFRPDEMDTFGLTIFLPDLVSVMGYKDRRKTDAIYRQLQTYTRLIGQYVPKRGRFSLLPVLSVDRDAQTNTVSLVSPFLTRVALDAYLDSLRYNNHKKLMLSENGVPKRKPTDSYLVRGTIASERNKRAVEIVCVVAALVEQAGGTKSHKRAQAILDLVPELKAAVDSARTNNQKNMVLERAFRGAWSLLMDEQSPHTKIREALDGFKISAYCNDGEKSRAAHAEDQDAARVVSADDIPVPTVTTLGSMVYVFAHNGKRSTNGKNDEKQGQ